MPASQPHSVPRGPLFRPLLPLLYVAWADGELSDEEILAIRESLPERLRRAPGAEDFLNTWLRPESPPTAAEMHALLEATRTPLRIAGWDAQGGEAPEAEEPESSPESLESVRTLERIVGVRHAEAVDALSPGDRQALAEDPGASIETGALRAFLDGDHAALRRRIRGVLSRPEFRLRFGLEPASYREQAQAWCRLLAREGLGGLAFPARYGGQGDPCQSAVAFEVLAFHDTSLLIKYGVQFGLFGSSIQMLGTAPHHEAYLRKVASLEIPGCFAMTELAHGSNVAGLETTATYDPESDTFVVGTPRDGARKEYIGNAACHGQVATVFAQLVVGGRCHGVHALLVPIRDAEGKPAEGVRIGDSGTKMGLNGVDNGRLWFDDVRVPRENLLDRFAHVDSAGRYTSPIPSPTKRFFTMLGSLVLGRLSIALASLSTAKTGLTIAVRYGNRRRQFGAPGAREARILDYLTHKRRLLPYLATAFALDSALKWVLERYAAESGALTRTTEAAIAGLKAYSSWYAVETLQACRECCGGQGYLSKNRLGTLRADTEIFVTFEGDNTVLMQLVAKARLSAYRRQLGDMRAFTVVRHLAARAEEAVSEHNPVLHRMTSRSHLRDPAFHAAALAHRERHLVASAARRLRHRIARGMASHDAFLECQDHLVSLARAHVERLVSERFTAAVEQADTSIRPVLRTLRSLFALSRLEADRAWYLESGYFAPVKAKSIRAEVNALCSEVRPEAVALTDAFGIPESLLPVLENGS